MSFDLGVWQGHGAPTAAEASRIYAAFCRGETSPRVVQNSPAVEAFYQDLTEQWPEAGNVDPSPWSSPLHHAPSHVLMSCVWSQAETVFPIIAELAARRGLVLFDPQSEEVYLPENTEE